MKVLFVGGRQLPLLDLAGFVPPTPVWSQAPISEGCDSRAG